MLPSPCLWVGFCEGQGPRIVQPQHHGVQPSHPSRQTKPSAENSEDRTSTLSSPPRLLPLACSQPARAPRGRWAKPLADGDTCTLQDLARGPPKARCGLRMARSGTPRQPLVGRVSAGCLPSGAPPGAPSPGQPRPHTWAPSAFALHSLSSFVVSSSPPPSRLLLPAPPQPPLISGKKSPDPRGRGGAAYISCRCLGHRPPLPPPPTRT